jgi:hypothetical protein
MSTHTLHLAVYDRAPSLDGVFLFSALGCARSAIPSALGELTPRAEMPLETVSLDRATSAKGVVGDEIHAFPWATQGPCMGIELLLREGIVIGALFGTTHTES